VGGALSDWITLRWGLRGGRCGLAAIALAATAVFLVLGSQARSAGTAVLILAAGAGRLYLSQSSFWQFRWISQDGPPVLFSSIVNMGGQNWRCCDGVSDSVDCQTCRLTSAFGLAAFFAVAAAVCWLFSSTGTAFCNLTPARVTASDTCSLVLNRPDQAMSPLADTARRFCGSHGPCSCVLLLGVSQAPPCI